jgi:hypothetical protein
MDHITNNNLEKLSFHWRQIYIYIPYLDVQTDTYYDNALAHTNALEIPYEAHYALS